MKGSSLKIKKGDTVRVIKGKEKGKEGKVERVFPSKQLVLITGINQYKRHVKARTARQRSEIVTITRPLPIANVGFVCPKCSKMSRVGFRFVENKKVRVCKKCEATV